MSNIYLSEPPTSGKVLIHTTFGDIDIELWSKEAPTACRNFIQLSLEGYYDNTIINRVVKDFMIQLGDPTGTGKGGTSIWGHAFKDEFHGRLKFNHRGQVAMANENKPNSNHSQFIVTLDKCEWLNRKHTIFGKVTGDTMFNVLRMGDVETTDEDRPLDDIKVTSIEVLWNPFEDIVPRSVSKDLPQISANEKPKSSQQRKAIKNSNLLSFENEETDGVHESTSFSKHSIHDSKFSQNSKLKSEVDPELQSIVLQSNKSSEDVSLSVDEAKSSAYEDKLLISMREKNARSLSRRGIAAKSVVKKDDEADGGTGNDINDDNEDEDIEMDGKDGKREAELRTLRGEIIRSRRAVKVLLGETADTLAKETVFHNMSTPLEALRQKYKKRKAEHGDRQSETLARLGAFVSAIRNEKASSVPVPEKEAPIYNGQILENDSGSENERLEGWYQGKLKFKKHIDDDLRLGGDGRRIDDIVLIDSRKSL